MGIKTRFSSMGGDATGGGEPRPTISDAWSYTTRTNEAGKEVRTLYFYNNAIGGNVVKVPYGYTELQDYYYSTNNAYSSLPFYDHNTLISVDLKNVPFKNNSMLHAFNNCRNLTSVNGINKNVTNMSHTFYYCSNLNQNIQIPSSVKIMYNTFGCCYNLNQNIQIPSSVTSMTDTFYDCNNLNQNIQIPNSVTSMFGTFNYCSNLNQNIQIPNSVTSMTNTFYSCSNLNQNIQIPSSVKTMYCTFKYCENLNQNIQIPYSVTDMSSTFWFCHNLNQNIQIPNSVTNMSHTFYYCRNLNQNIQIPNSVTDMSWTFYNCYNLGSYHKTINILSEEVSDATNAFYHTSYYNISNQLTIVFPLRYINNVNTVTRNSLVSAGYAVGAGTGVTAANATEYRNLKCFDWIAGDWNTYSGNGTHWLLTKWNGALTTHFNNGVVPIDLTFPNRLTSYATFPTVINISTYTGNTVINSIKVTKDVPWVSDRTGWYKNSKSRGGAFKGCTGLTHANVYINDSVLGMHETFMSCTNLRTADVHLSNVGTSTFAFFYHCDFLVNAYSSDKQSTLITEGLVKPEHIASNLNVASVHIPSTVTNVQSMYGNCQSLDTVLLDGEGITSIAYLREGCNSRNENIYIKSPLVTVITNWHRGYNASYRRNYYIPYMYANGTYTATHATLYAQTLMRNNATTNFYMYDISPYNSVADYVVSVNSTADITYLNTYRGLNHNAVAVTKSPFTNDVAMTNTTYTLNATLTSVDCQHIPFATTPAHAFRNCLNITHIDNLNIPDSVAANCLSVFENCASMLDNPFNTPAVTTQAAYMYKGCTNLGRTAPVSIVFGRNVVNFRQTFNGCSNFQGNIYFMCPTGSTSANKWNRTFTGYNASRSKYLWCYFTYSNGVNTATYNLLKGTALYNNNSTSNFYIRNIGTQPLTNNYNFAYNKSYSAIMFIGSCEGSTLVIPSQLEVGGSYADSTPTVMTVTTLCNCFKETGFNRPVQIPSSVTNMYSTFDNCHRLNQNIKIPSSVTTMMYTFYNCQNFNQNIQIPNSVTSMSGTFDFCHNLNQNIQIPNSVTSMSSTFSDCSNLNQNIQIPSSVTNMFRTFSYCRNLNQNIQIPNSVTDMSWTFSSCYKFNQNIQIPNSVTNMYSTFASCHNLNQNIQIPNSVTNMYSTFYDCTNLSSRIYILSQNITSAVSCFYSTSLPKDVYIPYTYDNGEYTKTYNSFNSAGYFGGINGVTMHNLNEDLNV